MIKISGKNLTFSGTDTLVFIILPNTTPIILGSLTTFSYSSYRVKRPVNTLGGIHIKGIAKGGRVIAGTMIFTMINQHWVKEVCSIVPWLNNDNGVIYSDELPLFDLMVVSANEYGKYVSMMMYGVDFTDEAQVLSINDMYSENTFSFISRELRNFDNSVVSSNKLQYTSNKFYSDLKFNIINWGIDDAEISIPSSNISDTDNKYNYDVYIKEIQETLQDLEYTQVKINGIIDDLTKNAIYDIMDRMNIDDKDFDSFIKDIYPNLNEEYIDNNNYYAKSYTNTYLNIPNNNNDNNTSFGHFDSGERIVVLDKIKYNGDEYYQTIYGLVYSNDVEYIDAKNTITDVVIRNVSIFNDLNKVHNIYVTITEFIESFYISVDTNTNNEYVTNAMIIKKDNTGANCVKKSIISCASAIDFIDAKSHLIENYYDGMIVDFIVAGINKNDNIVVTVKFNGGV